MTNERLEFCAYTHFPEYTAQGKKDTAWMSRFTFPMLMKFEGMGRVLTMVARGYLWAQSDPYENVNYARDALCAWCSVPQTKKATPRQAWQYKTNFRELHDSFPELVDEKGNGWLYRHILNMADFAVQNPNLVSKSAAESCKALKAGFRTEWEKKVIQMQVPIFAPSTKAAWPLRFDDILADALEQGPLRNPDIQVDIAPIRHLIPKEIPVAVIEELCRYYAANKPEDTDWVVLPVANFDAYFGTTSFSKKWLSKIPQEILERDQQNYGVCRYRMTISCCGVL